MTTNSRSTLVSIGASLWLVPTSKAAKEFSPFTSVKFRWLRMSMYPSSHEARRDFRAQILRIWSTKLL